MAYAFTFWTCYTLRNEYAKIAEMRLQFLASHKRRPDQFTVRCNFEIFVYPETSLILEFLMEKGHIHNHKQRMSVLHFLRKKGHK